MLQSPPASHRTYQEVAMHVDYEGGTLDFIFLLRQRAAFVEAMVNQLIISRFDIGNRDID